MVDTLIVIPAKAGIQGIGGALDPPIFYREMTNCDIAFFSGMMGLEIKKDRDK